MGCNDLNPRCLVFILLSHARCMKRDGVCCCQEDVHNGRLSRRNGQLTRRRHSKGKPSCRTLQWLAISQSLQSATRNLLMLSLCLCVAVKVQTINIWTLTSRHHVTVFICSWIVTTGCSHNTRAYTHNRLECCTVLADKYWRPCMLMLLLIAVTTPE